MNVPFDRIKLDALLERANADILLATSKHNVQYLLGGYRYFFFEHSDAIGLSRYLPVVGYVRDRVEDSFYVGAGNEAWGVEVFPIWVSDIATTSWSTHAAADEAARFIKRLGFEAPWTNSGSDCRMPRSSTQRRSSRNCELSKRRRNWTSLGLLPTLLSIRCFLRSGQSNPA
jgi:Xaa-Pro aminopeptidase